MVLRIAKNLSLPVEAVTSTSAIVGIRGSGKTNTAVVIVEEAVKAGQQVCVIDPLDVWWGLCSTKDGDSEGLPVLLLGGQHQHLPLEVETAETVARFVADNRVPVVLSLRHLSIGKQREFVAVFLEKLYQFKGEPGRQTPLLVVVDECSTFCPQSIRRGAEGGYEARCLGACETLVRRGRSSGFGFVAVDQRPASINKDVLTQLEVLIVHRVTSPQDRDALNEWVKGHDTEGHAKEMFGSAASLVLGQCWAWSPMLDLFQLTQIRERETFDSSKTPKIGETAFEPSAFAKVDVEGFRAVLETSREEARHKDPKWMEARIKELEAAGRSATREKELQSLLQVETERAKRFMSQRDGYEETVRVLERHLKEIAEEIERIDRVYEMERPGLYKAEDFRRETSAAPGDPVPAKAAKPVPATQGLSGPQQRMVNALASFMLIGVKVLSKGNLAVFSDQSPKSSGFRANLSALSAAGLIVYRDGGVELTSSGFTVSDIDRAPASLAELHRAWKSKLSQPQARMLAKLIELYPDGIHRSALATATNQSLKSSGYRANLSKLSGLGLLRYDGPDVKATDLLFPEGLSA